MHVLIYVFNYLFLMFEILESNISLKKINLIITMIKVKVKFSLNIYKIT